MFAFLWSIVYNKIIIKLGVNYMMMNSEKTLNTRQRQVLEYLRE